MTYAEWALRTFEQRIAPVLATFATDRASATWVATCGPGESEASRYRLYPGCLHLLWLEALGRQPSDADTRVAAGLECLHNASLHHDDVLDDHDSRRGVATLHGSGGASTALLAGDGLIGIAFRLVAGSSGAIVERLAGAWLRMTQGQWMDEPSTWTHVAISDRAAHWEAMTRAKLAVGNVAAPLAALTCGTDPSPLEVLHEDFSIASQIMNDLGDLEGWAGFHVAAACHRDAGAEAAKKPTFATIWSDARARAEREVEERTTMALERLRALDVSPAVVPVLLDFFSRPMAELRRTAA